MPLTSPFRIIQKLAELGWDDEIEYLLDYDFSIFSRNAIVNQPKDLTERSMYAFSSSWHGLISIGSG
jgi:hypothetical protein